MSGHLKDGQWQEGWYDTGKTAGEFVRTPSKFRSWITADGSSGYPAEPGRYHLYVSLACPWAHRTLIGRVLKGLQDAISVSVVEPVMTEGWSFSDALPDRLHGFQYLHQLYAAADPQYTGRVLVPALWDKKTRTIVSNESSEIMRMFDAAFCTSDEIAYGVARACREAGLAPGRDVTIFGFDGSPINEYLAPWLNTVRVEHDAYGPAVVALLKSYWSGGSPLRETETLVPYTLAFAPSQALQDRGLN